jgi:hypothetical protein
MIILPQIPILEKLSQIATVIGALSFFLAIIIFFIETRRRRHERELATYDNLAKEYRDFLKLCFDNYELQVFNYNFYEDIKIEGGKAEKVRKYILFEILVSLLESAYFQYKNHSNSFKKKQWEGWVQYMKDWCSRNDFQIAWKEHLSTQFDSDFLGFMDNLIRESLSADKLEKQTDI